MSTRQTIEATTAPETPRPQIGVLLAGLVVAALLGGTMLVRSGTTPVVLFGIGLALGWVLFHSRFGFTSAWRRLVAVRDGRALRAQMLMLAAACTLFAPILATGVSFGATPSPSLGPIGFGLLAGAFLFGVGMQLGGSCASGTLFAVGSGQSAIVLTLGGFVIGSVLGAVHLSFWVEDLPGWAPVSLVDVGGGYLGAWAISLALMALVVGGTLVAGRRARGARTPQEPPPTAHGWSRALRGSWPLWVGALLLAGLNALTLAVSGRAWGITFAFALWGSKILDAVGVDVESWEYWSAPGRLADYRAGVLAETTSVMDLGIIVGALLAAAAGGVWVLHRAIPARLAVGAVIGAYFGGIASFSLHGWLWGLLALVGTGVGLGLRPAFGLANPRPDDAVC